MSHVTKVSWSVFCAGLRRHAPAASARGSRHRLPPLWPLRLAGSPRPLQRCGVGRHECLFGGRACASGRHARGRQSGAGARGAGGGGGCGGGVCLGSVDPCQCEEGNGVGDQDSAGGGRGSARPPPPLPQGGVVHAATAASASFFFSVRASLGISPSLSPSLPPSLPLCAAACLHAPTRINAPPSHLKPVCTFPAPAEHCYYYYAPCVNTPPSPPHTACNRCILDFTAAFSTRTLSTYCSMHTSLTLHHRCTLPADWHTAVK